MPGEMKERAKADVKMNEMKAFCAVTLFQIH